MKSLYIVIVVFYFALPTVSRSIFDAKKRRAFKTNDADNTFRSYLLFAMEMECDETKDKNYSSLNDFRASVLVSVGARNRSAGSAAVSWVERLAGSNTRTAVAWVK